MTGIILAGGESRRMGRDKAFLDIGGKPLIEHTAKDEGLIIPVVITVYADRSYTFVTKTPPVAVLIKREAGIAKGSGEPNRNKVGKITMKQVEAIAKLKTPDLTAGDLQAAINTVLGTARSMGVEVSG